MGLLPGPGAFRLGETLGGWVCAFMPKRRKMILRNLRIAFHGEKDLPELRKMVKATFSRTAGNIVSAAHTAKLSPEELEKVIDIENLDLLEKPVSEGRGAVILLSHMGNWEVLSRIVHFFPKGTNAGAFYRPLSNELMDKQVLDRRQADGTRMFSKRDNPLHVARFLKEGGVVGILADQRVGPQGEVVPFCGGLTRASPLPSLLARRSKSTVLALSVTTVKPGRWKASFRPVEKPHSTLNCMRALGEVMKAAPVDVFWFQERWKAYVSAHYTVSDWLGPEAGGEKTLRALLWLADAPDSWKLPDGWLHPSVDYEVALASGQEIPPWLPNGVIVHRVSPEGDRDALQKAISEVDESSALPLDFMLSAKENKALFKAGRREVIPVVFLP